MNVFIKGVVLAATVAAAATASNAAIEIFEDYDAVGSLICTGLTCGLTPSSVAGTLDINVGAADGGVTLSAPYFASSTTFSDADGFRPGIDTALGGTFYVALRDDGGDGAEYVDIDLGGAFFDPFGIFEVDFGIFDSGVTGTLLAQINATGQLDWDIRATNAFGTPSVARRDLIVDAVGLRVEASVVPLPPAAALSLLGLAGLAGYRRMQKRKAA